jgi:tight adherence protein B
MLVPAAVFTGVILVILGAYWLFVVKPETKLLERLAPQPTAVTLAHNFLKAEQRLSAVRSIDAVLTRTTGLTAKIKTFIDQSGLKLTVGTLVLGTACAALGGYLLVFVLTKQPFLGLAGALALGFLPYLYVRRAMNKRIRKFEEQFPEAVDLMARALRAGHALPTGLSMVAEELPAPVGTEFRTLYEEQNFGLTLPDALRNFAARVPLLDARFFVTAVMTQREAGGNLAEVLDNLAAVIRERFKVKRQVQVISAHGRITGVVLSALPPSVAVASFVLSPGHLTVLLNDPLGVRMIETAVVMQVLGTLIIRKIVNIEY